MRPVALLVGISSYDDLALALGRPPERTALPGAPNDALRMAACCVRLGADPEDVLVLTGRVTARELRDGLRWLAARLAEPGTAGLLHFSGHGLRAGQQGWSLVSSDVGETWNSVGLDEVRELLNEAAPERDLTVMLDACVDPTLDLAAMLPDDAVLYLGTSQAPEFDLGGTRQGALSWALSTVLERWTWEQSGPSATTAAVGVSGLLQALQTGVDLRSSGLSGARFLAGRAGPRETPAPAAATREITPDTEGYKATHDGSGNLIAWLWSDSGVFERWHRPGGPHAPPPPMPDNWTLHAAALGKPPGPWTNYPHKVFSAGTQIVNANLQPGDQLWEGTKCHGEHAAFRILRGGAFLANAHARRAASRFAGAPGSAFSMAGVHPVRDRGP